MSELEQLQAAYYGACKIIRDRGKSLADVRAENRRLREALDAIAIALNVWFNERKAVHEATAKALRDRQGKSWGTEKEPWVFAEECIRRHDAETLEPIRRLMRLADSALAQPAPAPAEGQGEVERLDAARYRFLRPHLQTDGDVDDADFASRFYIWVQFRDERVMVPDAPDYNSVDDAIDAALAASKGKVQHG